MKEEMWQITDEFEFDIQVIEKGSFDAKVLKGGKCIKKFKGEMAHMDAKRLAMDLWTEEKMRAKW